MMNNFYSLLLLTLLAGLYSCSSGEYELDEVTVDYIEKIPIYDTLKITKDTIVKKEVIDIKDNKLENYLYVVQIGAFAIKSNFDNFIESAKMKLGPDVYYVYSNNLYKIRIGKFKKKSDALDLLIKVKSQGFFDAFVISSKE